MPWLSLELKIPSNYAEPLCDLFLGWGALAASIEYPAGLLEHDRAVRESVQNSDELTTVKMLLERECNMDALLHRSKEILAWALLPPYSVETVTDQDWVRVSREKAKPILIPGGLWIVPTWEMPPSKEHPYILLDPGTAFGTGRHTTTCLCLEWLVQKVQGGETVLDYGCGSGILAIAALKLGALKAVGIDQDPQAVEVSASNARLNQVGLHVTLPAKAPELKADLVVANIYANPLKALASRISGYTKQGGSMALTGILDEQVDEISEVYAPWFDLSSRSKGKDGLCCPG